MLDYNMNIQMVDLKGQYGKIKHEVDHAIQDVINKTAFINGPHVKNFTEDFAKYLEVDHVITCANGTDALQIALMALNLKPGDEVIVPCFTYVATAEVIALLKLKPVMVEVDPNTFNITAEIFEKAISSKTRAVVPVHLFGQCVDMEELMKVANKHSIFVVEDTAQAIGADYTFSDGSVKKAGTIGHIGCTSFFPSKNLGCYGDGGALYTKDPELGSTIKKIANHGQAKKYHHELVGVNSRLDTIQAAVLGIKLKYLDEYANARQTVAKAYDEGLGNISWIQIPMRQANSTHVFHQYTLKLDKTIDRENFRNYLEDMGIPSMVYYPVALHLQQAFRTEEFGVGDFPISESLCESVLSLPIHTEMSGEQLDYIISAIKSFKNA
jgi:UDP-2-acetamido-2-deoxy-ribo-hexuluronate aminotransferase